LPFNPPSLRRSFGEGELRYVESELWSDTVRCGYAKASFAKLNVATA
jgi:hypothetical protein